MPDARRQFRVLYGDALGNVIDRDLLASRGEAQHLLVQFAALLGSVSFVFAALGVPRYAAATLDQIRKHGWGDQEFLISTTMAVAGLLAVLAWNAVLPSRRDGLILGPLPVRGRTVFGARVAAVGTALGTGIFAVNAFTGLGYPFALADGGLTSVLRPALAYWLSMAAAGLFVFCALLAVECGAALLLGSRHFPRVSGWLQLGAFVVILSGYFLTPPFATPAGLTAPAHQALLRVLPSFWFLGLFQELQGPADAVFGPLAARAAAGLATAATAAAGLSTLAFYRLMRAVVEQPDVPPSGVGGLRLAARAAAKLAPAPLERALLLFTGRTLARSRQHRLLLAAYGGVGLAIALAYAKSLIYGYSEQGWGDVNVPLLAGSLALLACTVLGARAVFSLPVELPANWIFRVTAVSRPPAYFAAVRKTLLLLAAAPMWGAAALLCLALWPGRAALGHLAILGAAGAWLVDRALDGFRKIPFACSYLPGKSNVHTKVAVYGAGLLFLGDQGAHLEYWALHRFARFAVVLAVLAAAALRASRQRREFAAAAPLQFEDQPGDELLVLDFRRDSELLAADRYVEARPALGWRRRARRIAAGTLVVLACGFVYERFQTWRDHRRFPQVGRSYDIGGRSLNLYCSGEGSPAVILEAGFARAGYGWTPIQREIAQFTRACWYDRAGYGWSDPGPFPRHSDAAARDLHKLLAAARVRPPYILVGDGFGTFHVRVFNGFYPGEAAGLVLAEPFDEDVTIHIHNHIEALRPAVVRLVRTLGFFGFGHLTAPDPGPPPRGWAAREWSTAHAMVWQTKTLPARIQEPPLWISGELARRAGRPNVPVVSVPVDPYRDPQAVVEAVRALVNNQPQMNANNTPGDFPLPLRHERW